MGLFFSELFVGGGWVVWPLVIGSAFLWYWLGYRYLNLRRHSTDDVRQIIQFSREGALPIDGSDLMEIAINEMVETYNSGVNNLTCAFEEIEKQFQIEVDRGHHLVMSIVCVAPLLGLLGTVSGMIETFDSLADMSLFSQSGGIAGGISQALITTQVGLLVAVPGLLLGRYLNGLAVLRKQELSHAKEILLYRRHKQGDWYESNRNEI